MSRKKRWFLPFELDAFANCAPIGNACGLRVEQVSHGHLLLWQHVWRTKCDLVTAGHLAGFFFGVDPSAALVTWGILERTEGGFRVKGAAEWLRVMTAQSEAGKAHSGNLKRGSEPSPASSRLPPQKGPKPGPQPAGSLPALPATSDQRPATSRSFAGEKPPAPPKPVEPPDPRHAPLVKALVDAAPGYAFAGGRDAKAVTQLLALGEPAEVVTRWRRALQRTGYPLVRKLTELVENWNHFATAGPAVASAPLEQHTHTGPLEL